MNQYYKDSQSKAYMPKAQREDWGTPPGFLDAVLSWLWVPRKEMQETWVDVAASAENTLCDQFFSKHLDALSDDRVWGDWNWCNPPYGRQISNWVDRAVREDIQNKNKTIMLLPARTDTAWFHFLSHHSEILLCKGRLKFVGAESSAPFPSMVACVGFGPKIQTFDWRDFCDE